MDAKHPPLTNHKTPTKRDQQMIQRTLHLNGLNLRINLTERFADESAHQSSTKPVSKRKMMGFREFIKATDATSSTLKNKRKGSEG
jgi:hypothetical protein